MNTKIVPNDPEELQRLILMLHQEKETLSQEKETLSQEKAALQEALDEKIRQYIYLEEQWKLLQLKLFGPNPNFSPEFVARRSRSFSDKDLRESETRSIVTLCENRTME